MAQLEQLALDSEGWGLVYNNNIAKIVARIDSLIDTSKTIHATGTTQIADLTDITAAPAGNTSVATTSTTVSGTGDDATINTNFANLDTFTSQAVSDLTEIRSRLIDNQTILTNLLSKLNTLMGELREGTGIAILKA